MPTSNTADDVRDVYDYWHLEYEGTLELDAFMQSQLGWTDMELNYWSVTGKLPGEGCDGGPDKDEELLNG